MAEQFQGTVAVSNKEGTGFKLDGRDDWFNFSKNYTGIRPERGDRVEFLAAVWDKNGRFYVEKNTLGVQASSQSGASLTGSAPSRDDAILWQVCIKAAVECCIAVAPTKAPTAEAVLEFAHRLYDGRPGAEPGEPEWNSNNMEREPVEAGP